MSTPVAVPPGPADDRTVATIARVARERHPSPWPDAAVLALTSRIERDQIAIHAARGSLAALARSASESESSAAHTMADQILAVLSILNDSAGGHR